MDGKWITIGALVGLTGVGLGAFGAHGLKSRLEPVRLQSFEVGVRYQMYHALALVAVAWVASSRPSGLVTAAGLSMLAGVVLFSGSLYGLTLTSWKWLGPVTPLGGGLLMAGWMLLALAGMKKGPTPP
ncbi:MAG: DUF423 domain-containing protein [Phycisphaerae bacterium]